MFANSDTILYVEIEECKVSSAVKRLKTGKAAIDVTTKHKI